MRENKSAQNLIVGEFCLSFFSVIVHRSSSDKLAVAHSCCLFGAESYSGQRERKSVWQGFTQRFVNSYLANSPSGYIYTVIGTS